MKKEYFVISKETMDNVDLQGNILLIGKAYRQALVNIILHEKFEKFLILDLDGKIENLLTSSGLEIKHLCIASLIKDFLNSKDPIYMGNLIDIGKFAFDISLPAVLLGIEAVNSKVSEIIEITRNERIYLEAKYFTEILNLLLNLVMDNTCSDYGNCPLSVLLLKDFPISISRFIFLVFLSFVSRNIRDVMLAIPIEIMKTIRDYNLVFLMIKKCLRSNNCTFFGEYLGVSFRELLSVTNTIVAAGKVLLEDINLFGEVFPSISKARKMLNLEEEIAICTNNKIYIIDNLIKISEKSPYTNVKLESHTLWNKFNTKIAKDVLSKINLAPISKDELILYLDSYNETEHFKLINDLLLNNLIEEFLGRDGKYWLRLTPKGRLFLKVG